MFVVAAVFAVVVVAVVVVVVFFFGCLRMLARAGNLFVFFLKTLKITQNWDRGRWITHVGEDHTMQLYGNFEGFPIKLLVHSLGWCPIITPTLEHSWKPFNPAAHAGEWTVEICGLPPPQKKSTLTFRKWQLVTKFHLAPPPRMPVTTRICLRIQ